MLPTILSAEVPVSCGTKYILRREFSIVAKLIWQTILFTALDTGTNREQRIKFDNVTAVGIEYIY